MQKIDSYGWMAGTPVQSHNYLTPAVLRILRRQVPIGSTVLDLGCGNANMTAQIADAGYDVIGVEPSEDGVAAARLAYPSLRIEQGSAYENLSKQYGSFDAIVSAEVIEHLYSPHTFAVRAYESLKPGGLLVVSTPYHGYLKNLALSMAGKWDHHFTALEEHMHIKFFSIRTLSTLLSEANFKVLAFERVGRIGPLAKSMIAIARRQTA